MFGQKSNLEKSKELTEIEINKTNDAISKLGENTLELYNVLTEIQNSFDQIRNNPNLKKLEYKKLKKIRLSWKQQVNKIESDYKKASAKSTGGGAAGIGIGITVVSLGPTAAMGVATTFGVASTGTAISSLSGAAATNAALAWLGGGALTAGGGGMLAGESFLALAGPVGWAIAGISIVGTGIAFWINRNNKKIIDDVFARISQRDIDNYKLAQVEINTRIEKIQPEVDKLNQAINRIKSFGLDYKKMSKNQQKELGSYVNLMYASTELLTGPILGLIPKFTEDSLKEYKKQIKGIKDKLYCRNYKNALISLTNLFYNIDLNEKEIKLLIKVLKKNKSYLKALKLSKKDINDKLFVTVKQCEDFVRKKVN